MKNTLTPEESLQVITAMIDKQKESMNENGYIIRFWGWLVLFAALVQLILMYFELYSISWYPWFLMPLGMIYTYIYYYRKGKSEKKSITHFGLISTAVWSVFGINAILLGFFGTQFIFGKLFFGIILVMLAQATIAEGVLTRFKPLIWGGIVSNLLGFVAFAIVRFYEGNNWNILLLLLIIALIATNIIPGYLLKNEFRKTHV